MGIIRGSSLVRDPELPWKRFVTDYYLVTYSVPTKQPRPRSSWFNDNCLNATCPRLPLKQDAGKLNSGRAKKLSWCC
ncbi:hypothetical protein AFLA_002677 [Aspergillus flavus NRRL3357]|nr:hypothetical protein AFLA_002677 [Aspergillus flavus NRRL3357]